MRMVLLADAVEIVDAAVAEHPCGRREEACNVRGGLWTV